MTNWNRYRYLLCTVLCLLVAISGLAIRVRSESAGVDRAYLQSVWTGWEALDVAKQGRFYASGPRVYFDETPLKYNSWDEYKTGVGKILTEIQSAKFTVNNDVQIHPAKNIVWATATVDQDALLKDGKRDVTTFRWTVVFEKIGGKWLIVHEHISRPTQ
jgi:ketosteroid isomerase-like protein